MSDTARQDLTGQRVLLIGIGFYDYEAAIIAELQRHGAAVLAFSQVPASVASGPFAALLRRAGALRSRLIRSHHERILATVAGQRIDHVFVIKGDALSADFLTRLRTVLPASRFIAYHWDSLARYPELVGLQHHFDRVYTFDHADAKAFPNFRFRPLFFRESTAKHGPEMTYDLSFVGWLHHDRLRQVNALHAWSQREGLATYFYLFTGTFSCLKLKLKGLGHLVHARTLKYADYITVTATSRVVVDLPHPLQTGMTMRAIEAVGAGKKLVTTARDIIHYDFFHPSNVLVVDADDPKIAPGFLSEPMVAIDAGVVSRYSLASWVKEIFEVCRP